MFDWTKLFLGMVETDEPGNWKIEIYLVNPTDTDFKISQQQGSFQEDYYLGWGPVGDFVLNANSSHIIDTMEFYGELDFTTVYSFKIKSKWGIPIKLTGSFSGYDFRSLLSGYRAMVRLPVLNKKGVYQKLRI